MLRPVLFVHRWLGIVIGLLMTLWCLSGFVMMYVDYPRLTPAEQREGLAPLRLPAAAGIAAVALPADTPLSAASVEMMADRPVLRIRPAVDPGRPIAQMRTIPQAFDLATGQPIEAVAPSALRSVAATFGARTGIAGKVAALTETAIDQWTVQTWRRNAPLYRADFDDLAGTRIYVSGKSGEVVQATTRFERFWNWLGAVPHWLYPTILRQDGALWSAVVIWTSLIGCFLTATGLWVGIARLRRRRDGKIGSPYRGLWWWHHMAGLVFGILTLTWVASGLFSMNPWGFLDSMAGFVEREALSGDTRWGDVRAALAALPAVPDGTVRIEATPLRGKTFLTATRRDGRTLRFAADGSAAPLTGAALRTALARALPLRRLDLLRNEDAYYYRHKFPAPLPVWRATLGDAGGTLLYIDPVSGQILRAVDADGRGFRWLQDGLHSLDFPGLRRRPLWDIVVVPLLAMVTLVCATGTWMAWNKARRDVRRLRRRRARKRFAAAAAIEEGDIS